jgi:pimeloyl-ACP methyl ester carboxylesterase
MRARFDIVGFDPRGVGRSAPVRCFPTNQTRARFFAGVPQFPITRREQARFIAKTAEFGGICLRRNAAIMRHMSTANVARDMDLLRAVGDRRLTFWGGSYGSYLGNVYASLFPGRVRTLVFDSIIDPAEWATGRGDVLSVPVYACEGSDAGTAATMRQFLRLCDRAGPHCAFSAGDPRAKWRTLLARARGAPIRIPGGPPVSYAEIVTRITLLLADPPSPGRRWPGGCSSSTRPAPRPRAGLPPRPRAARRPRPTTTPRTRWSPSPAPTPATPATPSAGRPSPGSATAASARSDPSGLRLRALRHLAGPRPRPVHRPVQPPDLRAHVGAENPVTAADLVSAVGRVAVKLGIRLREGSCSGTFSTPCHYVSRTLRCSAHSAGLPCSPGQRVPKRPRSLSCATRSPVPSAGLERRGCPGLTGRS